MTRLANCKFCEREFTKKESSQIFCSRHCARKQCNLNAFPVESRRKCKGCEAIIGCFHGNVYCSKSCRLDHRSRSPLTGNRKSLEETNYGPTVRRIIMRERPYECEMCHNSEWMNKPIPLEIDHINGLPQDNRRDNIRLLCCNCHATTPTYRSKNIGNCHKLNGLVAK